MRMRPEWIGSDMSDAGEEILLRLSPGEADPILVADFQAISSATRLSEMLSEGLPGRAVFQMDPVRALSGKRPYIALPELAGSCADEFLRSGADHGRVFVVGHCSAAALSLRVAGLLAPGRPVTAVLVEPSWPDDEQVAAKFAEYLARFGPAARPCPELDADPCQVVSAMEQVFRDEIDALIARRGLAGSAGAFSDLLVWYRAWLSFLVACRNDTPADGTAGRAAVTVLTASPATVKVAGLGPDAYQVRELPAGQPEGVTRELAEIVAGYVAHP